MTNSLGISALCLPDRKLVSPQKNDANTLHKPIGRED